MRLRHHFIYCGFLIGVWGGIACNKASVTPESAQAPESPSSPTETKQVPPPPPPPAPAPVSDVKLAGAHILISYKGGARVKPTVTRTKEEALKLAQEIAASVQKNPKTFAEQAKKQSDCPSAEKGGDLGMWQKGMMVPQFDEAIEKLKIGEVSGVIETPFGYHVIMRKELPPPPPIFAGSHILIAYKGAMRAKPDLTRTKDDAQKLIKKIAADLKKDPQKFVDLSKQHSDDPMVGPTGGSLGKWPKGRMVEAFDTAIEKMKIGDISEPIETPFGFHVIRRDDPEKIAPPQPVPTPTPTPTPH